MIKYVFFQRRRLRPPTFESPWIHRGWTPAIFAWKSAFLQDSGQLSNDTETIRCCLVAGVQPRWIQGDSKVGTESASLEMTYLITDRKGLED